MTAEELRIAIWVQVKNMVIAGSTSGLVLGLYYMSHSWHSLWGLIMLAFMSSITFSKD